MDYPKGLYSSHQLYGRRTRGLPQTEIHADRFGKRIRAPRISTGINYGNAAAKEHTMRRGTGNLSTRTGVCRAGLAEPRLPPGGRRTGVPHPTQHRQHLRSRPFPQRSPHSPDGRGHRRVPNSAPPPQPRAEPANGDVTNPRRSRPGSAR